jgi:hypothetical protein
MTALQLYASRVLRFLALIGISGVNYSSLIGVIYREWYGRAQRSSPSDDAILTELIAHAASAAKDKGIPFGAALTQEIRFYHARNMQLDKVRVDKPPGAGFSDLIKDLL